MIEFHKPWDTSAAPISESLWRPEIFDLSRSDDRNALATLRGQGKIWRTYDQIGDQLRDLVATRSSGIPLRGPKLEQAVIDCMAGVPAEIYGRWVYYPWSGRLVHLLPPNAFRELRLDRNRYHITSAEQFRLSRATIGVVGLSAGHAAALTLALEGVGGHLKLADFDRLALSNMNRVRAGTHEIGSAKTVIIARQIMEIDPYLQLSLYPHGITPKNLNTFVGGDANIDVLVDACDALPIKVLLREHARARGIPVIMETSDRGLIDVERFDLEPQRPLLHGRLGALNSRDVAALAPSEQLGVIARLVGADTVSTRLAASVVEIGATLSTWPQLASAVTLGGASVTTAVRRIVLGELLPSGRRYIDLAAVLAQESQALATPTAPPAATAATNPIPPATAITKSGPQTITATPALTAGEMPTQAAFVRFVVAHAAMAPSGGNAQPWRFYADGARLWMSIDRQRAHNLLNVGDRPVLLALGAAAENICIAAAHCGRATTMDPFPPYPHDDVVARFAFLPGPTAAVTALGGLLQPLQQRCTNRDSGTGTPLTGDEQARLQAAAGRYGVRLELVADAPGLRTVAQIVGEAERIRLLCGPLHREMVAEMRWTRDDARAQGDGIDVATLAMSSAELAALRIVARSDVSRFLRDHNRGQALRNGTSKQRIESAAAVVMLSAPGDGREHWLQAGRAMQRMWIEATRLGLAVQPVGALLYLLHLLNAPAGHVLRARERCQLRAQKQQLDNVFGHSSRRVPVMMLRLTRAPAPPVRARRRPVADILHIGVPPVGNAPHKQCQSPDTDRAPQGYGIPHRAATWRMRSTRRGRA